jgi:hypothetical protein
MQPELLSGAVGVRVQEDFRFQISDFKSKIADCRMQAGLARLGGQSRRECAQLHAFRIGNPQFSSL